MYMCASTVKLFRRVLVVMAISSLLAQGGSMATQPELVTDTYGQSANADAAAAAESADALSVTVFWHGGDSEKKITLTFDDGPHPKYTAQILDTLKKYEVKATFFVIGRRAKRYPKLIQRILQEGHELGNHTYSHQDLSGLEDEAILEELDKVQQVLKEITGKSTSLLRPPRGRFNQTVLRKAAEKGYIVIMWCVDPRDWTKPGVDEILTRVQSQVKNGAIVALHDTNEQTVKALPAIIEKLAEGKYTFVTISQLIAGQTADETIDEKEESKSIMKLEEP